MIRPLQFKQVVCLSWAVFLLAADLCASALPNGVCAPTISSLAMGQRYAKLRRRALNSAASMRVGAAAHYTLARWEIEGRKPPKSGVVQPMMSPEAQLLPFASYPSEVVLRPDVDTGPYSPVQAVRLDGRDGFLRWANPELLWAAFCLRKSMGLPAYPKVTPVVWDGAVAVFSHAVDGTQMDQFLGFGFDFEELSEMVASKVISAGSLSEAEGFHFLVADEDGRSGNFILTREGEVIGFDFDNAFGQGFSWQTGLPSYLGKTAPLLYTRRFARGLRKLTDAKIGEAMPGLPIGTRRQVAFRRDLMLSDLEHRGEEAILTEGLFPLDLEREK